MTDSFAKYCKEAAEDYALRPDAGREDTMALIDAALRRAYGWRVEDPGPAAESIVALLEQAKVVAAALLANASA